MFIRPASLLLLFSAAALYGLFVLGCSNGAGNPVTAPETPGDNVEQPPALTSQNDSSMEEPETFLWGYYDLYFDIENMKVEAVASRSSMFTANVTMFLNMSPTGLGFTFNDVTPGPGYVDVDVAIAITHPLGLPKFNGYDVRGVFVGNGSGVMNYDSDLVYPVAGTDQILSNADGYTRWFNPAEFQVSGLFGYTPGVYAAKGYTGTATLNPYKYFAEGLGATDDLWTYLNSGGPQVGYFLCATTNARNYLLQFPIPLPGAKYGYAIVANWAGPDPDDHPSHAAEAVGVDVVDSSRVYYVDETDNGGRLVLDITVFDWDAELTGGVMQDYTINVESTVTSGYYHLNAPEMTPTASGDHWCTYHVGIAADSVTSTAGNEFWVIVADRYTDYTNPLKVPNAANDDPLAACFRFDLDVGTEPVLWIDLISPDGGEQWQIGENRKITWQADSHIQDVAIDLSLDSGASYTYSIISSTPNDGLFTWTAIPIEASGDLNRVRVSDADNAAIFDESDADFSISGDWVRVISPNGGEVWEAQSDQEITWESSTNVGLVYIAYSKDNFASDFNWICHGTQNDGSYVWENIPFDPSSTVRVIVFRPNPIMIDISDANFSIVVPPQYIHLLTPNGGEEWEIGADELVTWDSVGVPGNVNVYYSTDNFTSQVSTVASDIPNVDSFHWIDIPDDPNTTSRVKVESVDDPGIFDVSDADFSIVEAGWARTWGVEFDDSVRGIVTDPEGNIFVTGQANYDNPVGLSYIRKFDSAGGLLWSVSWGSEGSAWAYGIARDDDGYLYVTGGFNGTNVDFDPGPGTDLHTSDSGGDIFLSRFDSSGNFDWARTWGGVSASYIDSGYTVAAGTSGVYVTGWFTGTNTDFDPGPGTDLHTASGSHDAFLSRFSTSGDFAWAGTWGGDSFDAGYGIAIASSGMVFVAGGFTGTDTDFDPDPIGSTTRTSNGWSDMYLAWFDGFDVFQGVHTWGGTDWETAQGVAVDAVNNVYVSGYFVGADVDFDPGVGTDLHSSLGEEDCFVSKFDPSVSYLWAGTWGGVSYDEAYGVSADALGYVTVVGYFDIDADFDPGPGIDQRSSNGSDDCFWSRLDSLGNYVMAHTWGGTSWDECYAACMTDQGILYVGGSFRETGVEFAPVGVPCNEDSDIHDSNGDSDAFLIKYMHDGCW